jgi:hypothetical protein
VSLTRLVAASRQINPMPPYEGGLCQAGSTLGESSRRPTCASAATRSDLSGYAAAACAIKYVPHSSRMLPSLCPVRALLARVLLSPHPWLPPAPLRSGPLCSSASQLLWESDFSRPCIIGYGCAPLSTLRRGPHGQPRMTRGRCESLHLHCKGLAPSTPCRSPGASHMSSRLPR